MTTYTFRPLASTQQVNWNDPSIWTGGVVPSSPDADVIIPTATYANSGTIYASTIAINADSSEVVRTIQIGNNDISLLGNLAVAGALTIGAGGAISLRGGSVTAGAVNNNGTGIDGNGIITANSIENVTQILG